MRIIQLIAGTAIGGAESFAFEVASELARRGHEVLLLSNRDDGPLFRRARPSGMRVRALARRGRLDPRIVSFLAGSIRSFRPDVIHSHNFEANTWARAIGCFFPRATIVCHEHSGQKIRQPAHRDRLDRLLYRRCGAVFTVSEELKRLVLERRLAAPRRVAFLPNGILLERFAPPQGTRRDEPLVTCTANLTPVKNHAVLLRAWRAVLGAHPDARLTLLGDGPLREDLMRRAREDGIEGSVEFAGLKADVRPFLWRSAVFVLPSTREGLPLSMLEAMAAGLPCVASRVGGIPAALGDGEAGILVAPDSPEEMARALVSLLADPVRREKLGRCGRNRVAERYSLEACVDVIERTYRELRES